MAMSQRECIRQENLIRQRYSGAQRNQELRKLERKCSGGGGMKGFGAADGMPPPAHQAVFIAATTGAIWWLTRGK